jgi:hypothetical protein
MNVTVSTEMTDALPNSTHTVVGYIYYTYLSKISPSHKHFLSQPDFLDSMHIIYLWRVGD